MVKHYLFILILLLVASCHAVPAVARPHHSRHHHAFRATERALPFAYDRHAIYMAPHAAERTGTPSARHGAPSRGHRVSRAALEGASAGGRGAVTGSRPPDCYGIPWCGCWLKHQFDSLPRINLNLAINWARVGQPAEPSSANVVVWRHHVGKLIQSDGHRLLIQSGNDGGAVRTRWMSRHSLGGVVAFRRV